MKKTPRRAVRSSRVGNVAVVGVLCWFLCTPARTQEAKPDVGPVIQRLETAVAAKDKFGAEAVLAELERLIPADTRLGGFRAKVAAVPGPRKRLTWVLGRGTTEFVLMEFVLVRPGAFTMGSATRSEAPAHRVTISKPFYMGEYEVTQEQWYAVMGTNPSGFKGLKNPVENVSWSDCQEFIGKLNQKAGTTLFRLPTEAEWEYACRAGSASAFSFGDADRALGEYAWYSVNSWDTTHPVGQKRANAWGLCDMHGNVCEWCQDWYGIYSGNAVPDPAGPAAGVMRICRGGSWLYAAEHCGSAARYWNVPGYRFRNLGFRLVRAVP